MRRDKPPPVPGTNGTKWRFYCGIKQRKAGLSQGRVPFCPGEGSHLSQGRFLFVPDTVPPKMFMFIGFFLARIVLQASVCFTAPSSKFSDLLPPAPLLPVQRRDAHTNKRPSSEIFRTILVNFPIVFPSFSWTNSSVFTGI